MKALVGDEATVKMVHEEEYPARIANDGDDRLSIRRALSLCIHPLKPEQHMTRDHLINISTGEICMNPDVNVDRALELGEAQLKLFQDAMPEGFYNPIKKNVITMKSDCNVIEIEGETIEDPEILYARAFALQASGRKDVPKMESLISYELSTVVTAYFDNKGNKRSTTKAVLKNELAVKKRYRAKSRSAYFLDGCAFLWMVTWPANKDATLEDFIYNVVQKIRWYQALATVYLIFDR